MQCTARRLKCEALSEALSDTKIKKLKQGAKSSVTPYYDLRNYFFIFTKTTQKMKIFFKEMFEYSNHFNQKMIGVLDAHRDKATEKAIKLQNHIILAHEVWNSRLANKKTPASVWEIMPPAELKKLDIENFATSLAVIDARDFTEMISYKNLKAALLKKESGFLFARVREG